MKTQTILLLFLSALFLNGCISTTRYITEKYIKENVEIHKEGEFSTIKTFTIFKGISLNGGSYLELTGYKNNSTKALVIGADKYYKAREKFQGDNTVIAAITYIELSLAQCKTIVDNYKTLQDQIRAEKPRLGEEIYHDFTVSKDLFISYKKGGKNSYTTYLIFG